jgi:N-methylhydantoinase A
MRTLDERSLDEAHLIFAQIEDEGRIAMAKEMNLDGLQIRREVDISYTGQSHSVKVSYPQIASVQSVRDAFELAYRTRFGHLNEGSQINLVVLRVVLEIQLRGPELAFVAGKGEAGVAQAFETRSVYFSSMGKRVATAVYRRSDLREGMQIDGPAVIEEFTSTTLLAPGDRLKVGKLGELNIRCSVGTPADIA